jgi:hypothetical protein
LNWNEAKDRKGRFGAYESAISVLEWALLLLPKVLGADVAGREEREERRIGRGGFDGGAPVGFFAFDDADNRGDNHVGVVCRFNCIDG